MKKIICIAFFMNAVWSAEAQTNYADQAKAMVTKMTTEEKAALVTGMGMNIPGLTTGGAVGQTEDKVPGAAGTTFSIPRLGLPSIVLADGPAGLRITPVRKNETKTYYCTAFPVGTLLASTWDTALVRKVGVAMGNEVKEYGVDVLLAPALNIQRNPLGGRNFEYYSEDPIVAGTITAAIVNGVQSNGVSSSIKHFAANNQETNRMMVNTIASERAIREIYLRGFEVTVKTSNPKTVMSSYNLLNGTYTSEEYALLTTILREEWGYKGLVMTDWFGGKDAAAQMKAGNDLLMPGLPNQRKAITDAVANGSLPVSILNTNAERVVALVLQSPSYKKTIVSNTPDLKAHALISRAAATEGMILLKNDNLALPLKNTKKIAAFGNTSYNFIAGGTGSGDVNKAYTISLVDGLTNAGYTVDETLRPVYETYITAEKAKQPKPKFFFELVPPVMEMNTDKALIEKAADETDVAIITIGRNSGEFLDRKLDNDFNMSLNEMELIKNVSAAFHAKHKKVIVLLNTGGVIETASWSKEPDAILLAWQSGQEGGNAVADILSGNVNPSGKLTVSFPLAYTDAPSANNFPGKILSDTAAIGMGGFPIGTKMEVVYEEGIYVGYRYYNTFNVKTAYDFGFGLSYTNFNYTNLKLSSKTFDGSIKASVTITNMGKVAGKEVVQLYLSAPAKNIDKPSEELKGFAKTSLLQPGKSETITFAIDAKLLASYVTEASGWVAQAGTYVVKIGASGTNIRQKASFDLTNELMVEKCHKVLVPQVQIKELKK